MRRRLRIRYGIPIILETRVDVNHFRQQSEETGVNTRPGHQNEGAETKIDENLGPSKDAKSLEAAKSKTVGVCQERISLCLTWRQRTRLKDQVAAILSNSGRVVQPSEKYAQLPPLPPMDEWRTTFRVASPLVRDRVFLRNPQTSEELAQQFVCGKWTKSDKPKVIIEAFPGAYCHARVMHALIHGHVSTLQVRDRFQEHF